MADVRPAFAILLVSALTILVACNNFYVAASPRGGNVSLPGQQDDYSQPGQGKYQPHTGAVQVIATKEELDTYVYEPLSTLREANKADNPRSRPELISALQSKAARLGANAIAITDEKEMAGETMWVRANAVRIIRKKETSLHNAEM